MNTVPTLTINTIDNKEVHMVLPALQESPFLQDILKSLDNNTSSINLSITYQHMDSIYTYMKYSILNDFCIHDIPKPCMHSVGFYLKNTWFDTFFHQWTAVELQELYTTSDYLGINRLCLLIVAQISYMLNTNIIESVNMPSYTTNTRHVYNMNTGVFEHMTPDELHTLYTEHYVNGVFYPNIII